MVGGSGLSGHDIRGGIEQADDVMHNVQGDMHTLAKETRWEGITGKDRQEFFRGLTQEEWDTMKSIGTALGPKGENKLEMLLKEIIATTKENADAATAPRSS